MNSINIMIFDDSKAAENLVMASSYIDNLEAYMTLDKCLNEIGNLTIYAYFDHLVN
jgi:hypothetical protein